MLIVELRSSPHELKQASSEAPQQTISDLSGRAPRVPSPGDMDMSLKAYGAQAGDTPLEPMTIERRRPGPHDVEIDIAYCGVCHSDLHTVRSEWGGTLYPCVPGHEIVGHVSAVGSEVTQFKVGDVVEVGCMVDSCQRCFACDDGLEQYCEHGFTRSEEH